MNPFDFDETALQGSVDAAAAVPTADTAIPGSAAEELSVRRLLITIVFQVVGFGLLAAIAVMIVQLAFGGSGMSALTWLIAAVMVAPLAITQIRGFRARRRELGETAHRLARFAADNAMTYVPAEAAAQHPIVRFRHGGPLAVRDLMRSPQRKGLEVGTYHYEQSMGRSIVEHSATFVSLDAPVGIASMTVASKAGDAWSHPSTRKKTQHQLSIDDEFDAHIRVYCAPQDDDAVRQQLTPTVRAAVRELVEFCDVEVDGGRFFVLARKALPLTNPVFWHWVGDLSRLGALLSPQGGEVYRESSSHWAVGATERNALFATPRSRWSFALGLGIGVLGLSAAAVITAIS
ncbi:MAG: hypothetical protein QM630_05455 [Microbacterium sp.]